MSVGKGGGHRLAGVSQGRQHQGNQFYGNISRRRGIQWGYRHSLNGESPLGRSRAEPLQGMGQRPIRQAAEPAEQNVFELLTGVGAFRSAMFSKLISLRQHSHTLTVAPNLSDYLFALL